MEGGNYGERCICFWKSDSFFLSFFFEIRILDRDEIILVSILFKVIRFSKLYNLEILEVFGF